MNFIKTTVWIAIMALLIQNAYAKEIDPKSVKIEYINFDEISLGDLFGFLSREYKINFSVEPEKKDKIVSVNLRNATLEDLLDNVLVQNSMLYRIRNNIVYVASNKHYLEKRFTLGRYRKSRVTLKYASVADTIQFLQDMMPGRTVIRTSTENKLYSNLYNADPDLEVPKRENTQRQKEGGGDLGFRVFSDNYDNSSRRRRDRNDPARYGGYGNHLNERIIPEDILFIVPFYNENKIYLLSTNAKMIREAKKLIKDIDKPLKQVLIKGQIMEFTVGDGFKSIFDFQVRDSALVPKSPNPLSSVNIGNLKYAFLDSRIVANIDIAKKEGRASYISSPMLLTMNKVSAKLDLTEEVSVITGVKEGSVSTYDSGTVVVPPIPVYETKKLGTQLTITPHINNKDEILLKIDLEISSLSGNTQTISIPTATGGTEDFTFDSVSESSVKTLLSVANNKTIVFGGLIRENTSIKETKVPLLGDIPLIGAAFRKTEEDSEKKELVIILTPTIVDIKSPAAKRAMGAIQKDYRRNKKHFRDTSTAMNVKTQSQTTDRYNKEIEEFLRK